MNHTHSTTQPGHLSSPPKFNLKAHVGKDTSAGDPIMRLIARYTSRAFLDYIKPPKTLAPHELRSACQFVHSPEGRDLLAYTSGQPARVIRQTLETLVPDWESSPLPLGGVGGGPEVQP